MNIDFITDKQGYIEYLINFTKATKAGKNYRKRFYTGFSFIYILIWIAIFVYVIYQNQIPTPYFIMSIIIYGILLFNMKYFDVHTLGAKRRALKDISSGRVVLGTHIFMTFTDNQVVVRDGNETVQYKTKNINGYSITTNYYVLYIHDFKAYVLPKNILDEKLIHYFEKSFTRTEV